MRHGSLFSGIGGFDLAAEWMGWENIFHCEWNEFGHKVLKHYWPKAETFTDITKSDFTKYANKIDILTGGFPCQPYSTAGKRLGTEDDRHLWPEMLRAIREISPRWIVGENVRGLTNWNGGMVFDEVQADLEAEGYEVLPFLLPACAVNAPHRRDRIWFIAYASSTRTRESSRGFDLSRKLFQEAGRIETKQFNQPISASGTTPNTNHSLQPFGLDTGGNSTEATGSEGSNREQGEASYRQRVRVEPGTSGKDATDTQQQGLEGREWSQPAIRSESGSEENISTNTNSRRQSSEEHRQEKPGQFTETGILGNWQEFPTVSPLCNGNDGFSSRLDFDAFSEIGEYSIKERQTKFTFSKWRNESIKAGGNAIVPQVAYEIFKAIQLFNQTTDIK
jgi:DNA (cytosine-5)-methyltransferase 1